MPNVMGREFPYTPEGMAAADQYRRTFGMRDGGMMGFRPIGMQEGGSADTTAIVQGLYDVMGRGTTDEVRDYIDRHRMILENSTKIDDPFFNTLRNVLPNFPAEPLRDAQLPPQGQPDITAPLDRYPMDEALQQLETSAPMRPMPPEPMPYFNPDDIAVANGGYITRNRNRGGIMSLRRR